MIADDLGVGEGTPQGKFMPEPSALLWGNLLAES
jgi:hypothetical protein